MVYAYGFAAQTVASGGHIAFEQGAIVTPGSTHLSFTFPSTVNLLTAGVYRVSYYLIIERANATFALFLDNFEVPGSRYSVLDGASCVTGSALVSTSNPGALTLRDVGPEPVDILTGVNTSTVCAAITVQKI